MNTLKNEFFNPSEEFSPIPFWFWNDRLTHKEIKRQIHDFNEKGVNGFVLHPRLGVPKDIEYLSDIFMDFVLTAVKEADELGMSVILYDEAMYPSGSAKGKVVKENPEYASRGLKMLEFPCEGETTITIPLEEGEQLVSVQAVEKQGGNQIVYENTQILSAINQEVSFTPPNQSKWAIICFIETYTRGTIRGIHEGEDDREENAPASADLLNPLAVKEFINLTHDRYYEVLKEYFGTTITAFFTDEPDLLGRNSLRGLKPWTTDFLTYYIAQGNQEKDLPALWFEADQQTETLRKNYHQTVNQKMGETYYAPLSIWCEEHEIALTGHPAKSGDIGLLEYFQVPGQDVVWRWVAPEEEKGITGQHSTAGKCSADAARHRERSRNLNEVLGVCGIDNGWHLPGGDMKWYLDWLFVRGVNLISPHAFYYSIRGRERSHERPPDVGPNNIWWPYYNQFSAYIKRLSWLMTDSVNQAQIAVLCEEDSLPWKIVKPLYEQQIEFNYLEEELLNQCVIKNGEISIAKQNYRVILVEDASKFSEQTLRFLESFQKTGGFVLFLEQDTSLDTIGQDVLHVIDREIELIPPCQDIRLSLVEKAGQLYYLLVHEGEESFKGKLQLNRVGGLEKWDPWKGNIEQLAVEILNGKMKLPFKLDRRESVIIHLDPNQKPQEQKISDLEYDDINLVDGDWNITFHDGKMLKTSLESRTNFRNMQHYSGTLTYEQTFQANKTNKVMLDLGEVYEIAEVWLNGQEVGVKMWAPYHFEIGEYLVDGDNELRIKVTNSRANEMDQLSLPSGLIGPVNIRTIK